MTLYEDFDLWGEADSVLNEDAVKQSALSILTTPLGSRFFQPEFGSKVEDTLFELNDVVGEAVLRNNILAALKTWDTRIVIDSSKTKITRSEDPHELFAVVVFGVAGFAERNVVLSEGFSGGPTPMKAPQCRPFYPDRLTVSPGPGILQVALTPSPPAGIAPLPVVFAVSVQGLAFREWSLTFGDGSEPVRGKRLAATTAQIPHTYTRSGIYRATLRWVTEAGDEGSRKATVKVIELSAKCALPFKVRLLDNSVVTRRFLLAPFEIDGLTHKSPLVVSGRWDGQTYVYLVSGNINLSSFLKKVEPLTFVRDGSPITAWARAE